ncbi:MAG: cobyric acid synthase [Candidatus Omnitrophota bacterium]|nr:cobyric acid synthase [Candidatus Omnitrophota bacterium]
MKRAKTLQICGTGSGVGKSVIVSALCRIFLQDGYRVCPFKAQNMALNSFVTKEEGEIGRAQASQAAACRIEPSVDMNPILIKPTSDIGSQIIVRGKPYGNMKAAEYIKHKKKFKNVVKQSFARLSRAYDIVVIEGAGSPAEINLKRHDLVNMKMARHANAPVILVGDIDKGGVFAWLVGTLELLNKEERKMIKGIIINKFRGDKSLLLPAVKFLERRLGIKVLGVVPYFKDIRIPEEDSVSLDERLPGGRRGTNGKYMDIAVIQLPHISNFTDFDAIEKEGDVMLRYVKNSAQLNAPDLIIIPGTKNTISDLRYLKVSGLAEKIISHISSNISAFLLGICGGYQMLGKNISDKHHLESNGRNIEGLGLLPVNTYLAKDKVLSRVKAKDMSSGAEISGYEIHHGLSGCKGSPRPFFEILERNGKKIKCFDGFRRKDNRVLGTYIHGLFDADVFRREFLNTIRQSKGWQKLPQNIYFDPDGEFDKLAQLLRGNINMKSLYDIVKV